MNAQDVLQEFAEAAKPPSGRRHYDAEAGALARTTPAQPGRDWSSFVAKRQDRRGPDDCWPWRDGSRIEMDKGMGSRNGKRIRLRPAIVIEFRRLVWQVTHPDATLPRFVYSLCGDEWCSNPRHFSDKAADRPKRKVIVMSAKQQNRDLSAKGTAIPIRKVDWAPDQRHTAESALLSMVQTLGGLDPADRRRVLAALVAFHGDAS